LSGYNFAPIILMIILFLH